MQSGTPKRRRRRILGLLVAAGVTLGCISPGLVLAEDQTIEIPQEEMVAEIRETMAETEVSYIESTEFKETPLPEVVPAPEETPPTEQIEQPTEEVTPSEDPEPPPEETAEVPSATETEGIPTETAELPQETGSAEEETEEIPAEEVPEMTIAEQPAQPTEPVCNAEREELLWIPAERIQIHGIPDLQDAAQQIQSGSMEVNAPAYPGYSLQGVYLDQRDGVAYAAAIRTEEGVVLECTFATGEREETDSGILHLHYSQEQPSEQNENIPDVTTDQVEIESEIMEEMEEEIEEIREITKEIEIIYEETEPTKNTLPGQPPGNGGYAVIEMTIEGLPEGVSPEGFTLTLTGAGGQYVLSYPGGAGIPGGFFGGCYRWTVPGMPEGEYTIQAEGLEYPGFVGGPVSGGVTVGYESTPATVVTRENTCSHTDWPVQGKNTIFAATLTQRGTVVLSQSSLSFGEMEGIRQTLGSLNGPWKEPVHFYCMGSEKKTYSIGNAQVTWVPDQGKVIMGDTSQWQQTALLSLPENTSADAKLLWRFTPEMVEITIEKRISGNFGDVNRRSGIALSWEGGSEEFGLRDGMQRTVSVPMEAEITLREYGAEEYSRTLTVNGVPAELQEDGWHFDAAGDCIIVLENHRDILIDTGVALGNADAMLGVFGLAGIFGICRKRRR